VRIGALETAEVATVEADARHEEAHGLRRRAALTALLRGEERSRRDCRSSGKNKNTSLHRDLLFCVELLA
jgi:hypothetical protein